jgi:ADP-ribosylation factor 1/2
LQKTLAEDELRDVTVLVLANKQDLPRALSPEAVAEQLGLRAYRLIPWCVHACIATSGDGLHEALDWLSAALSRRTDFDARSGQPRVC